MVELIWDGKYVNGKKSAPVRLSLPFQDVETVNESVHERQLMLDLWSRNQPTEWRNRLIWGDKKYVLPSLLPEFEGKVNLIYIDPPFATGADFSFAATIPDDPDTEGDQSGIFTKQPSMIEQKAYRDTWGRGVDGYLQWFYETAVLLQDLLSNSGMLYVHLDWHIGHYAKAILEEVFGADKLINEIIWYYENKLGTGGDVFDSHHDTLYVYGKTEKHVHNAQYIPVKVQKMQPVTQKIEGKRVWLRDEQGNRQYAMSAETRRVGDVWEIPIINPVASERIGYPTQKPEALLERIIKASSNEGDLVLDCFCGSGTTAAIAEKLGRRWIAADLGRFAIHTTRKRLLSIPDVRPFVVQNLGKYERQAWQAAEFGDNKEKAALAQARYRRFILDLYGAQPLDGYTWLHGVKAGHMVHVGSVDAPVAPSDIKAIAREFWKAVGKDSGASVNAVDVLGWAFAFELNEIYTQMAAEAKVKICLKQIPREVLEKKAVEQGDIRFFELAALSTEVKVDKVNTVVVRLTDFVVSPDDVPEEVQKGITHWSQLIDYWAIDWDYKGDTFHNQWQSYRTKKQPKLQTDAAYTYPMRGIYTILIKVIDILGNDTTKAVGIEV